MKTTNANQYTNRWMIVGVLIFLTLVSTIAFSYYFNTGQHLPYADAISRLNIARKVVDNLNPGLAQLGSVWLPLPQILMLPFIWNDYMWQSGLAGSIMSMTSFIIGGYFLYKSAYLISKSFLPSFFTLCIYALNINIVYLQTTAMSECIFVCLLSIVIYEFLMWVTTNQRRYLIYAGVAVSGITLIRYEGLALLLSSILMVILFTWIKNKTFKRIEGDLILYCFIACFGFVLWTIYLTAIFGDPLFWLRYYGFDPTAITDPNAKAAAASQSKPFIAAVWQYFTSVTWMTGLIPIAYSVIGLLIGIGVTIRKNFGTTMVLMLPLSVFLLMVLTLQRNTPIVQPDLTVQNIISTETSLGTGFNIRYGLMLLPWLALLSIYVFNLKKPFYIPTIIFFAIFSIQLINTIYPHFTAIYEIPRRIYGKPDTDLVTWMQQNYDGGYILMSASGFEDQMFAMGLPYKTYIHEGAGKYWSESLDRPARYADWIIVDFNRKSDWLAKELVYKQFWSWDYNIAWQSDSVKVYKIKTKPDINIDDELN
jgi:hypothetical protein